VEQRRRGNHVTAGRAASLHDPRRRVHRVGEHRNLALDVTHLPDDQRPGVQCATQTALVAEITIVIPTGYSFNLDAFSTYLTLAVVFLAQATNTPLSIGDLLLVLAVSLVTSKGAHGVPGSAIVILAATLNAVPSIPAIGLVLVLSVDWFIGMGRALGNLIGNCVATVVVAAWEKELDLPLAEAVLDSDVVVEARAA
jgi:Na+/H+-dicarboxylate symporter